MRHSIDSSCVTAYFASDPKPSWVYDEVEEAHFRALYEPEPLDPNESSVQTEWASAAEEPF